MTSTTGTTIEGYLQWIRDEVEKREYGSVIIDFTICSGQITMVKKTSMDAEKIPLSPKP